MANVSYEKHISSTFPNQKVSAGRLEVEVRDSQITVALDYIQVDPANDKCIIFFKASLTSQEEILLDQIVGAHSGAALASITNVSGVPYVALFEDNNRVQVVGRKGDDVIAASHDFADKTTWYTGSQRTSETLSDSGDGLRWTSQHPCWIDLEHGKVHQEKEIVANALSKGLHGWSVVVHVDGVEMLRRPSFSTDWTGTAASCHYYVDYVTGEVVFQDSQAGKVVTAEYSYALTSEWLLLPSDGKSLSIEDSEVQFAEDTEMNDSIVFEILGYVQHFLPESSVSGGGSIPDNTRIPLGSKVYDTFNQLIDDARGAYPQISPIGGTRGFTKKRWGFPFYYGTVNDLKSSLGMALSIRLAENIPFVGERATATFYCASVSEKP